MNKKLEVSSNMIGTTYLLTHVGDQRPISQSRVELQN